MKPREQRQQVLISARMRSGMHWADTRILNISSRGLLLHASRPPAQGSFLEIRRGTHVIIARVVWTADKRFGVQTQDTLNVEAIKDPDISGLKRDENSDQPSERRSSPRNHQPTGAAYERSRLVSRAIEFGFLGVIGFSAATAAYQMMTEALQPLQHAAAFLDAP